MWPLAARAQQPALPLVGVLTGGSRTVLLLPPFRQGLKEAGFVEGQNVMIESRFAEGQYDRLSALAIELLSRRVTVIVVLDANAAQVVKPASATIPVVFSLGADPVELGLIANLSRPGGNMTGVSFLTAATMAKMLEMLHEAVATVSVVGMLLNPTNRDAEAMTIEAQQAARILGLQVHVLRASTEREIDAAFTRMGQLPAGALVIAGDPFFGSRLDQLVALAARHAIPAIYPFRTYPDAGGLMSYGSSIEDAARIAGVYVGRILNGENPADLPVQQSVKVELVLNLKTAKALGLTVPPTLLARADQVIE
jgi:putative tryptophan/tyrosine transport system substrate-binding protein